MYVEHNGGGVTERILVKVRTEEQENNLGEKPKRS